MRGGTRGTRHGALVVMVLVAGCHRAEATAETDGRTVFLNNCARCHGADATGGKSASDAPPPRNLRDPAFLSTRTDAQLRATIVNGKDAMPPFGSALDDRQLDAIVRYVRSLPPLEKKP